MEARTVLFFLAGSLDLALLSSGQALACPSYIQCGNFTQSTKVSDCNFVNSQSMSFSEKQSVLCVLWDNDYTYLTYSGLSSQPFNPEVHLETPPLDNGRFIIAGKISLFIIFHYALISLTKLKFIKQCLPVV